MTREACVPQWSPSAAKIIIIKKFIFWKIKTDGNKQKISWKRQLRQWEWSWFRITGCKICYSFYIFINQKTLFKSLPCWVGKKYNFNSYWDPIACPQGFNRGPRVLTAQNLVEEATDCVSQLPLFRHSATSDSLWPWGCSIPGSPTFLSSHCFHTSPGRGGLDDAGKTGALCSHSTSLPSRWGDCKRWGSGTHSLGFHNNLCAIPRPEGNSPNFSNQAIATSSLSSTHCLSLEDISTMGH